MPRIDLLALSIDDLELLSNRGIVKRARRELDENEFSYKLNESQQGDVTVTWSDDVICKLPFRKTLSDAQCTCAAAVLCGHIIRSVLAYQIDRASAVVASADREDGKGGEANLTKSRMPENASSVSPAVGQATWDPGEISDEQLSMYCKASILAKARKLFDNGQVVELVRSVKPFARFHSLSHTLKFLVPNDLRYTRCDCADHPPCIHAPLAIWAFRKLDKAKASGVVFTSVARDAIPLNAIDAVEKLLIEIATLGISGVNQSIVGSIKRMSSQCLDEGLIWPSEILNELILEIERYQAKDARFSALHTAELIGELCIRLDAIRADTGALPQMFIRGSRADCAVEVSSKRMIGLGCGGSVNRNGVELVAYFQELSTGNILTVKREFETKSEKDITPFWKIANKPIVKAVNLEQLGSGQILAKGGKLSPSREWVPGRTPITVNRQMYKWEQLKAPAFAENFYELRAVIAARSPSFLGPRHTSLSFYICAVEQATNAHFSEVEQLVEALLIDSQGRQARLISPYLSRCREGTEVLLHHLQEKGSYLRFVAGPVRVSGEMLIFQPVSLVFDDGQTRTLIQPWIDRGLSNPKRNMIPPDESISSGNVTPLSDYSIRLLEEVGQLVTIGLDRADSQVVNTWVLLRKESEEIGFSLVLDSISQVANSLESKQRKHVWQDAEVADHLLTACVIACVLREVIPHLYKGVWSFAT